ncbi:MAG TPA: pirin family protein [Planctomycetia bacterium]|nr:pirin family protein [Planctomycetia bacterium]
MMTVRRADERGGADHGWLDTRHTFSFAGYRDPRFMGFRNLRVLNEDKVAPGQGFGEHPHRDMEIVTYVLDGTVAHADSLGNAGEIKAGELQRITAGTGIEHSERNPNPKAPVHFYQIWILPKARGLAPGYEQRRLDPADRKDRWALAVSPDGAAGSMRMSADARIHLADLSAGKEATQALAPGRSGWLQLLRGRARVGDVELSAGDGVALSEESSVTLVATTDAEAMLFDLG